MGERAIVADSFLDESLERGRQDDRERQSGDRPSEVSGVHARRTPASVGQFPGIRYFVSTILSFRAGPSFGPRKELEPLRFIWFSDNCTTREVRYAPHRVKD